MQCTCWSNRVNVDKGIKSPRLCQPAKSARTVIPANLGSSARSLAWSLFIVVESWSEKVGGCGSAGPDRAIVSYLQERLEIHT
jgi:hypothetical protein